MKSNPTTRIGLIELPANLEKEPRWGTVVGAGPGAPDFNGDLVKVDVEPGQTVYVNSHGQHEVKGFGVDLPDLTVASVLDVLAIMVDLENTIIQPLGNLIEFEKVEIKEEMLGQLFMPDIKRFPSNIGRIRSLGKGWKTITSTPIQFQVAVGDLVLYNPFAEITMSLKSLGSDKTLYCISQSDIYAIVDEND